MLDVYISTTVNTYPWLNKRRLNGYISVSFPDGHSASRIFENLTPRQYLKFNMLAIDLSLEEVV